MKPNSEVVLSYFFLITKCFFLPHCLRQVIRPNIWPWPIMMSLPFDSSHGFDLGLCICFTKQRISQAIFGQTDLVKTCVLYRIRLLSLIFFYCEGPYSIITRHVNTPVYYFHKLIHDCFSEWRKLQQSSYSRYRIKSSLQVSASQLRWNYQNVTN